jgi:2-polyprenyl-3-methyl-5-hydroxy-6-metoxy-1,4-benzoquinol methylase
VIGPHLGHPGGTVLDIGTHFGAFAHWLDDLGYKVTAIESSALYAKVATGVRDICGKDFEIIKGSVFDLEKPRYDIVFALNIFHHFLKTKDKHDALVAFLRRLDCKTMIFEAHDATEKQMDDAYRNMEPDTFVRFVADTAGLTNIDLIGHEKKRGIFKLWR